MTTIKLRVFGYVISVLSYLYTHLPKWAVDWIDFLLLTWAGVLRLFIGSTTAKNIDKAPRPSKRLILYQYEGCPFCKKVREALNVLDLDYMCYPCPRETFKAYGVVIDSRYRPTVNKLGGKQMYPFLVDENTGTNLYDSEDIVNYLIEKYGTNAILPWNFYLLYRVVPSWVNNFLLSMIVIIRPLSEFGYLRCPSKSASKPLEMWGSENSPFSKRVRETLDVLELPYVMHSMPQGSLKRESFKNEHIGSLSCARKMMKLSKIPYLKDPNTGAGMFESLDIVTYIRKIYQNGQPSGETFLDYSSKGSDDRHGTLSKKTS